MPDLLSQAFSQAPIALCVTQQRKIACCNAAFSELFGWDSEVLHGQSMAALYPSVQEFQRIGDRGYPQMRRSGRYQDERLMRHHDGALLWCRVTGQASDQNAPSQQAVWVFEPLHPSQRATESLSPREREVVTHLAQGMSSKEIARQLDLSPRTVEMHRARLLRKMGVKSTTQLLTLLV